MLKPLIVANWKMNTGPQWQPGQLISEREVVICPPFTSLHLFKDLPHGAQNMHWEEAGAFTGEVSASMLTDLGCSYVLIGHSERRQYFNETNETVSKKVTAALHHGLTPIVCVRTLEEVTADLVGQAVVIAYEPVWAIGTGQAATPEHAQEIHGQIRAKVGDNIRIIYGGSVTPDNAASLLAQPDVNGLLVGGASLAVDSFLKIIQA